MTSLEVLQSQLRQKRRQPVSAGRGRLETSGAPRRRVALGADHGGYRLKEALKRDLLQSGHVVEDVGTFDNEPVDYPDFALAVAQRVASGDCECGIVIDGAGLGSCMVANKVRGVRAATCHDEATVRNSREHNNANVLALGAGVLARGHAQRLVRLWLEIAFAGGRHARRVDKIDALDVER